MVRFLKLKTPKKEKSVEKLFFELKTYNLAAWISFAVGVVIFVLEIIYGDYLLLTAAWLSVAFVNLAVTEWGEVISSKKKILIIKAIIPTIVFLWVFGTLCIDIIFHL